MSVLTIKFGGTSMGNADIIQQVAQIILDSAEQGNQVLTVVSAMTKVTDMLIKPRTPPKKARRTSTSGR